MMMKHPVRGIEKEIRLQFALTTRIFSVRDELV